MEEIVWDIEEALERCALELKQIKLLLAALAAAAWLHALLILFILVR